MPTFKGSVVNNVNRDKIKTVSGQIDVELEKWKKKKEEVERVKKNFCQIRYLNPKLWTNQIMDIP
jgi:hypothetical protein